MNVRQLITNAYYLSNIVARNLQTVTGGQLADGLELLNDILGEKTANSAAIPYIGTETFNGVVGQEEYFVNNLVEISTLTVTLDDVRFQMTSIPRRQYWGDFRVNDINSLPYSYYSERAISSGTPGMSIFVYWRPSQTDYIFEVVGKYLLTEVDQDTVISNSLERYYLSYLKYELAKRLCDFNDLEFPAQKMQQLLALRKIIKDVNAIDTSEKVVNQFPGQATINWALVNFPGWLP